MSEIRAEAPPETFIPSQGERLAALEGSYAHVATKADVAEVRTEIAEVRTEIANRHSEVMSEISNRHSEVMSEIASRDQESRRRDEALHREMIERYDLLKAEIDSRHREVMGEIASRHREVMSEIAKRDEESRIRDEALHDEITKLGNRLTVIESDLRNMRWFIATIIALAALAVAIANFLLPRLFPL